jgi:hypothetical protein
MGRVGRLRGPPRRTIAWGLGAVVASCGGAKSPTPDSESGGSGAAVSGASSSNAGAGAAAGRGSGGSGARAPGDTGGAGASGGRASGGRASGGEWTGGVAEEAGNGGSAGDDTPQTSGGTTPSSGGSGGRAGAGGVSGALCPFLPSRGIDVASRLTAASSLPVARAATIVSTTTLDGTALIEGQLSSSSDEWPLVLADETSCEVLPSTYRGDVHAVELVGEGPHHVEFATSAGADVVLGNVFQSLEADASALDLDAPCAHWVGSIDEWTGAGYRLVASGLAQGTVLIAVATSTSNNRKYTLEVSSSTSCSGSPREIVPGADAASTPFVDPNPMACTAADLRRCEAGVTDPTGGDVAWTDCCITDFIQNPEGKCGLSGNGSACFERQEPGNLDESCPAGSLQYSFPPNTLRGDGTPCCNWRTGLCGLMNPNNALDLGCSALAPYGEPSTEPCTPDYAGGITF